jgi:hypothetical protein
LRKYRNPVIAKKGKCFILEPWPKAKKVKDKKPYYKRPGKPAVNLINGR